MIQFLKTLVETVQWQPGCLKRVNQLFSLRSLFESSFASWKFFSFLVMAMPSAMPCSECGTLSGRWCDDCEGTFAVSNPRMYGGRMNGRPLCSECENARGRCSQCDGKCNSHGCEETGTCTCGDCRQAKYCSLACQRAHWPVHKLLCKVTFKGVVPPSNVVNLFCEYQRLFCE